METRAHFVLIGGFTLAVVVGVFVFVLWFAGNEIDREFAEYDVIFDSSVVGLSEGGDVRYAGIKVGEVKRLSLDPKNPSRVIARIRIDENAPITKDSKAKLEVQGLTGVAFILLTGGGPNSPKLVREADQEVPVILGEPSALQDLVSGVPDVLSQASVTISQLQLFLTPENSENIATTLVNLRQVSETLSSRQESLAQTVDNLHKVSEDLATASEKFDSFATSANRLASEDAPELMKELRETVASVRTLSDNANGILAANAGSIQDFADNGLTQIGPFLSESRETMETLDRVLQRMESDPARYLSGNYSTEYEAEQ